MEELIEWHDIDIQRNQELKDSYTSSLAHDKEALELTKEQLLKITKCKNLLHEIYIDKASIPLLQGLEADVVNKTYEFILGAKHSAETKISVLTTDKFYYEERINDLTSEIAYVNELLASAPTTARTIFLADLKEQLLGISTVKFPSICIYKEDDKPFLKWQFYNIFYEPSGVPDSITEIVQFNGMRPLIPIGETEVSINLKLRSIKIKSVPNIDIYAFGTPNTVHPHVLDGNTPCMGDFIDPLQDALRSEDWATAVLIVQSFLSHVNNEDSAGRYWKSFFFDYMGPGETAIQIRPGVYVIRSTAGDHLHPLCKQFLNLTE